MSTLVKSSNLDNTITVNNFIVSTVSARGSVGTAGQVLASDGANVYWTTNNPTAAGADTEIQFNSSSVISSNNKLTYNTSTALLSAPNISSNGTITATAISANGTIGAAGQVLISNGTKTYWGPPGSGVTSISTGTGLAGGPISTTGTIYLTNTSVNAGNYGSTTTIPVLDIDAQGRITGAVSTNLAWSAYDWDNISNVDGKPNTLARYGIIDGVSSSRTLTTDMSIDGGGDLSTNRTLTLVGDALSPGNNKYYGTNSSGVKGWQSFAGTATTDNAIARFNGVGGALQNSGIIIDDNNNVSGIANLTVSGTTVLGDNTSDGVTINATNITIPNSLNFDNNTLFINSVSNRVGLGTNVPLATLDIVGNITQNVVTSTGVIDCSLGNYFKLSPAANMSISFTNIPNPRAFDIILEIVNGGAYTISWAGITWLFEQDTQIAGRTPRLKTTGSDFIKIQVVNNVVYGYSNIPAGGSVQQVTSKSTAVTLNTITGQIITASSLLTAGTEESFTLNNSFIAADDIVVVQLKSGGSSGRYLPFVSSVTTGSCIISITNLSGSSPSEALTIGFRVLKGSIA